MSVSSSCAPATVTANQSSRHCLVRSTRSSGKSFHARCAAFLAISAVTATVMLELLGKGRSLSLSRHDVEDVPVLGIAPRRDAVGLFFLEHLEIEPVEQPQRLVARQKGHAGAAHPAVAGAVPLAAETPADGKGI